MPQIPGSVQVPSASIATPQVFTPQASIPQAPTPEESLPNFSTSNAAELSRVAIHSLLSIKGPAEAVQSCSSTPMSGDKSVTKAVSCGQPVSAPVSHPSSVPSLCRDEPSSFDFLCSLTSSKGKYIIHSWPSVGKPMNSHHEPKRIRIEVDQGRALPLSQLLVLLVLLSRPKRQTKMTSLRSMTMMMTMMMMMQLLPFLCLGQQLIFLLFLFLL